MNKPVSLTIGMIVKNEQDQLGTCLRSLQPLRDALDCQLIITDTGSDDGTQDIAKQFADDYLEFSWCDDFSKARNTGVEQARGRWFLYVDADHEFDQSILQIIPFLNTPSVDDLYDSASLTIENYTGSRDHITGSFTQQRPLLVNFSKGKRYFQHRIHESIPVHPHSSYTLPTTILHWGYLDQERQGKSQRNRRLLQEQLKEDPHNLKHHLQLLKDVDTLQEKKELLLTALALGESNPSTPTDPRLLLLYTHLLKLALEQKDWTLFDQTKEKRPQECTHSVLHCDYLGLCLHAALLRGDSALALSLFAQFRPLFFQFQEKPDSEYGMLDSYFYAQARFYYQIEPQVFDLLQTQDTPSAPLLLQELLPQSKGFSYSIQYENPELFSSYLSLLWEQECYDVVAKHYDAIRASRVLSPLFDPFVMKSPWSPHCFKAFAPLQTDYFTSLCQVWVGGIASLSPAQQQALTAQGDLYTNPLSCILVSPLIQEKQDPFSFLQHCSTTQLLLHSQRVWEKSPDLLPLVVASLGEDLSAYPLPYEKFSALLSHQLLTHLLNQNMEAEAKTLFPVVQGKIAQYCHKVYQEGLVPNSTRDLLSPPEELALAWEWYQQSNTLESQTFLQNCVEKTPLFSVFLPVFSSPPPEISPRLLDSLPIERKEKMLRLLNEGKHAEALALLPTY